MPVGSSLGASPAVLITQRPPLSLDTTQVGSLAIVSNPDGPTASDGYDLSFSCLGPHAISSGSARLRLEAARARAEADNSTAERKEFEQQLDLELVELLIMSIHG